MPFITKRTDASFRGNICDRSRRGKKGGFLTISGFRREVDENCPPLSYYATVSGNLLPTFRDNLTVPSALPWSTKQRVVVISK